MPPCATCLWRMTSKAMSSSRARKTVAEFAQRSRLGLFASGFPPIEGGAVDARADGGVEHVAGLAVVGDDAVEHFGHGFWSKGHTWGKLALKAGLAGRNRKGLPRVVF